MTTPNTKTDSSLDGADCEKMLIAIRQLLNWMATVNLSDKRCLKAVGLRVLAAAWVMDPARFDNRSLHAIALQLGFGANNIAPHTADFSRRFGITNQFQSHNWRTKKGTDK